MSEAVEHDVPILPFEPGGKRPALSDAETRRRIAALPSEALNGAEGEHDTARHRAEADEHDLGDDLEDGDDDDALGEDEGDESESAPRTWKFKADGKDIEANEDEVIRYAQMGIGFHQKTQQLAQVRAQTEQRLEHANSVAEAFAQRLELLQARGLLSPGDEQIIGQVRAWQQGQARQQIAERIQSEAQVLREVMPEWADKEVASRDHAQIRSYAHEVGLSDDELSEMFDHRALVILHDAARYRAMMAKGKTLLAEKTDKIRSLPPGGRTHSSASPRDQGRTERRKLIKNAGNSFKDAIAAARALPSDF
jgi:hypothetical protein